MNMIPFPQPLSHQVEQKYKNILGKIEMLVFTSEGERKRRGGGVSCICSFGEQMRLNFIVH